LYPRAWRDRYADEVLVLIEDGGAGIGDFIDLAFAGLRHRADELQGGAPMPSFYRSAIMLLAAVVATPTAIFIGYRLLHPGVGIVPPGYTNWLIPLLPAVALLIALAPVVRVELLRDDAGVTTVTTRILPMRRALAAVVILCLALLGVVVAYGISENLLGAFG
jgi:hypothetical protein